MTDLDHNQLQHSTSPYLLQHAHNPVHWQLWNERTLQLAREAGKPILLSIGYSACHWCHVMAHESFEDETTAALMNLLFVNIKVDREQRPDLDKIYQLTQQVLTQHSGGWPLTMFLSHDTQQPFFGGTYFPPVPRQGMPGFQDLLQRVAQYYHEQQPAIAQQQQALLQVFADLQAVAEHGAMDDAPLHTARTELQARFDTQFGGFGGAPKFPQPRTLELLLRQWRASSGNEQPDLHALYMCALTLTRMANGGVYDQLGGGFFRYSVDQHWMIPHFEKMLYDNAELLRVYAQAATATGDPLFRRITAETAQWLLRDLRTPQGSFYSALDADSEGQEGAFYRWDVKQLKAVLSSSEYALCSRRYGLEGSANFEDHWHLHGYRNLDEIAAELSINAADAEHELHHARQKLLALRNERMTPGLDNQLLTAWNGLVVAGLCQAARCLDDDNLIKAACATIDQLRAHAWRDGRLYAVQAGGRTQFPAYLDDYAFLLAGLLELLQTRWRNTDLYWAIELAEALLTHFSDHERGGFYFTAADHEALIHRSKTFSDEATPAGNAIAAQSLLRLGYLLGEPRYLHAAEQTLRADWAALQDHPIAHASLLVALEEFLQAPQLVIIRGHATEINQWQQALNQLYKPARLVFAISSDTELPGSLSSKRSAANTLAYVCHGTSCGAPVQSLESLIALSR
jgi:uncharacterized protein YyaL (SSP411 family)